MCDGVNGARAGIFRPCASLLHGRAEAGGTHFSVPRATETPDLSGSKPLRSVPPQPDQCPEGTMPYQPSGCDAPPFLRRYPGITVPHNILFFSGAARHISFPVRAAEKHDLPAKSPRMGTNSGNAIQL